MKPKRSLILPILSIGIYLILAMPLRGNLPSQGPSNPGATFTVSFSDGSSILAAGKDTIGLQPNQAVAVVVQYPLSSVGRRIAVVPLDGGRILGASKQLVVDAAGTIQFQFQAGTDPGIYQVSLRDSAQEIAVNFWVLDSDTPENNPIVVNQ
jgi:hypothetical protein